MYLSQLPEIPHIDAPMVARDLKGQDKNMINEITLTSFIHSLQRNIVNTIQYTLYRLYWVED